MKIQCACGTKYSFELTPEMTERPVQFVCQTCGLDASATVNEMIRREVQRTSAAAGTPAPPPAPLSAPVATIVSAPASAPMSAPPPPPRPAPSASPSAAMAPPSRPSGMRISTPRPASTTAADAPDSPAPKMCFKHPGNAITEQCVICKKPLCPKCMEMFGYVCSPFCRNKAEAQGIDVPVFAGQRSVADRRRWRKVGLVSSGIAAVVLGLVGFWIWYAWFGSVPKPVFAVRFEESAHSGHSVMCGVNQIVFLHGATLARYDMKTKKEIWSRNLIDKKMIEMIVNQEIKGIEAMIRKANDNAWEDTPKMPSRDRLIKDTERMAAAAMDLYVAGSNVWVNTQGKLARFDWDTGNQAQEVPFPGGYGDVSHQGDELVMSDENNLGQMVVTHLSLVNGESHVETIGTPVKPVAVAAATGKPAATTGKPTTTAPARRTTGGAPPSRGSATAGLPLGTPGADRGKPMDPDKVAAQAGNLSAAATYALPALLSNSRGQERIMNEMDDRPGGKNAGNDGLHGESYFAFVPSPDGYVKFSSHLLEEKIVRKKAMKDPPKKSALDGNVNASSSLAVANELLNEMQRERGGDTIEEDLSRYQVTVRRPDGQAPDYTAEVEGPPSLHALKTVNLIAAGTSLTVLDKNNKKLWTASLTHKVHRSWRDESDRDPAYGQGPCVERGDRLYVFDEAVLSCFDLATGNANWRIPSIGIEELFFDDKGMMYVNTSAADPESLKFARQIDLSASKGPIVLKIDPKQGKILWASGTCGPIAYLSGKFIYTCSSHDVGEDDNGNPREISGLEAPSYLQIRRINPSSGRQMWEHYENRAPWDIQFKGNYIQLVFRKEVEVLKFLSF